MACLDEECAISALSVMITNASSDPCFRLSRDIAINKKFNVEIFVNVCVVNRIVFYYSVIQRQKKLAVLFHLVATSIISLIYLTAITIIIVSIKAVMTASDNVFFSVEQKETKRPLSSLTDNDGS